jgi:hypothetical protein
MSRQPSVRAMAQELRDARLQGLALPGLSLGFDI